MRGYFYFWFSCGYRSLRWMCLLNGIPFQIRKVKKMEMSFLDVKEYLNKYNVSSYGYKGNILVENSLYQTQVKKQNHFIYVIKTYSLYSFIFDSSKLIVFRLVKNEKLLNVITGYFLTLKSPIRIKHLFFKVFSLFLTIIKIQIFIFILKILLNVL